MSLIILSGALQEKTFFVTGVKKYSTKTGQAAYLPPWWVAVLALPQARAQGCRYISVSPDGLRPRRYEVSKVEEWARQHPTQCRGLIPQPPSSPKEALYRRAVAKHYQQTQSGLLFRDD